MSKEKQALKLIKHDKTGSFYLFYKGLWYQLPQNADGSLPEDFIEIDNQDEIKGLLYE